MRTQRLSWPSIAKAEIKSVVVGRLTCLAILQSVGAEPAIQDLKTVPSDVELHAVANVEIFTSVLQGQEINGKCRLCTYV